MKCSRRLFAKADLPSTYFKEVEMPLPSLEELSPRDRLTYRRWVGGVFATYGTILMLLVAFAYYQATIAPAYPTSEEASDANSRNAVDPPPVRHAVKYD
jgi:hypothetical protein